LEDFEKNIDAKMEKKLEALESIKTIKTKVEGLEKRLEAFESLAKGKHC
jgi:hypothetical protein